MHKKNRVVCLVMITMLVLSGCFPWDTEEDVSVNLAQQPVVENKQEASDSSMAHTGDVPTACTSGQPLIENNLMVNVPQQSHGTIRKKSARRRRRGRKKDNKVAPEKDTVMQDVNSPTIEVSPVQASDMSVTSLPTAQESIVQKTEDNRAIKDSNGTMHTIEVRNDISMSDLAVKHWTGTYTPTKLIITINDIPLTIVGDEAEALGIVKKIPHTDNRLTVRYSYEFLNGLRKGSDTLFYTINEANEPLPIRFSWDTPWHVELKGAQRYQ